MSAVLGLRVHQALRRIGGTAYLLGEDGKRDGFTASIQPASRLQNHDSGPLGTGRRKRATLYSSCNTVTRQIKTGSRIMGNNSVYRVLQTETIFLAGRELYLWAALEWEEESK